MAIKSKKTISKKDVKKKSSVKNKKSTSKKPTSKKKAVSKKSISKKKIVDKTTKALDKFTNDLDIFLNKTKGIQVSSLSQREQAPYYIPTGNYALNWIITDSFFKGLPGTKSMQIAGEQGKGKSLICDQFLGTNIKNNGISYKVEIEDAGGKEFTAAIVGSQEIADKIRIIEPTVDEKGKFKPITVEKLTSFINQLVQYQIMKKSETPIIVVIDSISQLTSDKEFTDIQKDKDTRDMTVQQKMRAFFRVLTQQQRIANLTIIGIAHMTANIGVMFGPKTIINSKGSGFKYASSLDLEIKGNKDIKSKGDTTIGYMMKFKTTKNRFTFKNREVWIKFYTYGGIDKYSGLCQIMSDYGVFKPSAKADVNKIYKDSTTFTWNEYKFKEKDLPGLLQELGEEETLNVWMKELNDAFLAICKREGLTEEDIVIDSDDEETLEEDESILEQIEE